MVKSELRHYNNTLDGLVYKYSMDGQKSCLEKADYAGNGSIAGGYLPALFGYDEPMVTLLGSFIGGIIGIWIGYKFSV
jgi:phage tail tape-measure protein